MLIRKATLANREGYYDILIEEGYISKIKRSDNGSNELLKIDTTSAPNGIDIIEANGNLVLPPFIDPHVHLDTALTAGEPCWNESGTLFEGIECWSKRKNLLNKNDATSRIERVIEWQIANGIQYVRTHIDITDPNLTALKAMLEIKEKFKEYITIQIVAFPQEGVLSYPNAISLLEKSVKLGADVVGGIPHFEFTREYGVDSIEQIFKIAKKYNTLIDIHCDEIDDEQSRFIETVAARAYENNMGSKVTASHTTAMHSYNNAYTYKLFKLLKLSEINFVANPLVNIHLQGRFDTYPKRRGITRVKELLDSGINVCFGHDDILDPWYPLGTSNMLQVLHMGLHVCQIMGHSDINNSINLITHNSAKTLNIVNEYGIEEGKPGSFVILAAENVHDAIRMQANVLYSIRNGKILVKTKPSQTTIYMNNMEKYINFKK